MSYQQWNKNNLTKICETEKKTEVIPIQEEWNKRIAGDQLFLEDSLIR